MSNEGSARRIDLRSRQQGLVGGRQHRQVGIERRRVVGDRFGILVPREGAVDEDRSDSLAAISFASSRNSVRFEVGEPDSSQWNNRMPAELPGSRVLRPDQGGRGVPSPRLISSTTMGEAVSDALGVAVAAISGVRVGAIVGVVDGAIEVDGPTEQAPSAAIAMTDTTTLPLAIIDSGTLPSDGEKSIIRGTMKKSSPTPSDPDAVEPIAVPTEVDAPYKERDATPAEMRALGHGLRWRILRITLNKSMTNKQIAERLGRDPGTILHHVKVLVREGFLAPEGVRAGKRGAHEIPYRATGKSWRIRLKPDAGNTAAILDAVREEVTEMGDDAAVTTLRLGVR